MAARAQQRLNVETTQGRTTITLDGHFDYQLHQAFKAAYESILPDGDKDVVIDLSATAYVDSAALGMLLLMRDYLEAQGIEASIRGASGDVAKVLRIARFERYFTIH